MGGCLAVVDFSNPQAAVVTPFQDFFGQLGALPTPMQANRRKRLYCRCP
jgi:hypothetical protein